MVHDVLFPSGAKKHKNGDFDQTLNFGWLQYPLLIADQGQI